MKKLAWTIILIFNILMCSAQEIPSALGLRFQRCDTQSVLISLVRSEKLVKTFPKVVFNKYYDTQNHVLLAYHTEYEKQFVSDLVFYFNKASNKSAILGVIDNWCGANKLINELANINAEFPAEAILFNTKQTKWLVQKYLNAPQQSWNSLSSYELYELNIDFLNFVDGLSLNKKRELFSNLKKAAVKLSNDYNSRTLPR